MAIEGIKPKQAQDASHKVQDLNIKIQEIKPENRVRDEASIALLRGLREKLLSKNISTARVAASNLAWKQEDGLAILAEALLGDYPRTTKKAAAYGLRKTNGRMQKMALEILQKGLKHRDRTTKAACIKCLSLMEEAKS
jgi:hypothetical protein